MSKTLRDQIPKVIMHLMINDIKKYMANELLANLYREARPEELMEESASEAERRKQMMEMYQACKDALKIISEVNLNTKSEPVPPPVENSIAVGPSRPRPVSPRCLVLF